MSDIIVGSFVKYADPKAYGGNWVGIVREIKKDKIGDIALVKWDPTWVIIDARRAPPYNLTEKDFEGLWHLLDTLVLDPKATKIGQQ